MTILQKLQAWWDRLTSPKYKPFDPLRDKPTSAAESIQRHEALIERSKRLQELDEERMLKSIKTSHQRRDSGTYVTGGVVQSIVPPKEEDKGKPVFSFFVGKIFKM